MIPEKREYGIMVFADDTVIYNENRQQLSEDLLWREEKSKPSCSSFYCCSGSVVLFACVFPIFLFRCVSMCTFKKFMQF